MNITSIKPQWKYVRRILHVLWLFLTVGSLVFVCMKIGEPENRDADLVLSWLMLVVCFPSSIIGMFVNAALGYLGQGFIGDLSVVSGVILTWAVFFVLGYLQWFVVLPAGIRRLRRWRNRKSGSKSR